MKFLDFRVNNVLQAVENTEYLIAHESDPRRKAELIAQRDKFLGQIHALRKSAGAGNR
jgi:hypothetical protein